MVGIRDATINVIRRNIPYNLQTMEILDSHGLKTDLFIDSIAFLSILVELENILDMSFDIAVMDSAPFKTVGTLVDYIIKKTNKNAEGGS